MTIKVTIEGKGQVAEFPDGTDQSVIDAVIKRDFFTPKETPLSSVPMQALKNLPGSAVEFGKNIVQPVLHPVDTVTGIRDIAFGGLDKIIPGAAVDGQSQKYEAFKQALSNRYGGYENIKNTLATDPVGSLADVSSLLTGGGSLAARVPGIVGRAGSMAGKVGAAVEPLGMVGKAVAPVVKFAGNAAAGAEGFMTGAGKESIKKAYQAGKEGVTEFTDLMRRAASGEDLRIDAKTGFDAIKNKRSAEYRTDLADLSTRTNVIDKTPIETKMAQLEASFGIKRKPNPKTGVDELDFSRSKVDKNAVGDVESIIRMVEDWGSQPGDLTPLMMDTLKQRLHDFSSDSKNSKVFVSSLEREVKNAVVSQVPEYASMLKKYETATGQIDEITKTLSLGDKTSADIGIRKLISSLKDNNEFRGDLIGVLDAANNGQLAYKLAGYNLKNLTPSNLVGRGIEVGAISSLFYGVSPSAAIGMSLASPRVIGELALALGKAAKRYEQMKRLFPAGVRNTLYQAGRATSPQITQ